MCIRDRYNDDLTGIITVKTNPNTCTGEIGAYINNEFYKLNLTNGTAVFNVNSVSYTHLSRIMIIISTHCPLILSNSIKIRNWLIETRSNFKRF